MDIKTLKEFISEKDNKQTIDWARGLDGRIAKLLVKLVELIEKEE